MVLDALRLEALLLRRAEIGAAGETCFTWRALAPCVVLGRGGKAEQDLHPENLKTDRVPVYRRISGGGTVFLAPDDLVVSLIMKKTALPGPGIVKSGPPFLMGKLSRAFGEQGISAEVDGFGDLTRNRRKFAGSAWSIKRDFFLYHVSAIAALDAGLMERYLKIPAKAPAYRENRPHGDFLTEIGAPVNAEKLLVDFGKALGFLPETVNLTEEELRNSESEIVGNGPEHVEI